MKTDRENACARITPRDIAPYTLQDYWESVCGGNEGLAYQWSDKPHRHVYDLIAYALYLETRLRSATREDA